MVVPLHTHLMPKNVEPVLDGVLLSEMGSDGSDIPPPKNMTAAAGANVTRGVSWEADIEADAGLTGLQLASERPTVMVLGCRGRRAAHLRNKS